MYKNSDVLPQVKGQNYSQEKLLLSELCPIQSLISEEHYASTEIESRLRGLEEEHTKLHDTWKKRQNLFSQCYELQVFLRDAEQRDGWIGTQEAFLANEDLGVSMAKEIQ